MDAFPLEISGQSDGFVLADVAFVEPLAVEIADFHLVIVQERDRPDTFARKSRGNVAYKPPGPDAEDLAARKHVLVKAGDLLLPVLCAGDEPTFQPD